MSDIAIVPAPRELTVHDGRWITADPLGEAVRDVVENLDAAAAGVAAATGSSGRERQRWRRARAAVPGKLRRQAAWVCSIF